jgi:hypothetical protein
MVLITDMSPSYIPIYTLPTTDGMPLLRNDAVHENIVLFGGQEGQVLI